MMCFVLQVGTQKADKHLTCKFCVQAAEIQFKEYKGYKSDVHPYQSAPPLFLANVFKICIEINV